MKILKVFGITMITSANIDWFHDPLTYVIIVESAKNGKVLGGARLQISGGQIELPIESAVSELDSSIHSVIKTYREKGTAEVCGLWNSREIAGLGVGSVFLIRTAVAVAPMLNVKSLWALCAPYTIEMAEMAGFEIATFVGNEGTFYYPKDDLLATAMVLRNLDSLERAQPEEKNEIMELRSRPIQNKIETSRRGDVFEIAYDLEIKNTLGMKI